MKLNKKFTIRRINNLIKNLDEITLSELEHFVQMWIAHKTRR